MSRDLLYPVHSRTVQGTVGQNPADFKQKLHGDSSEPMHANYLMAESPLTENELKSINAYWRAANLPHGQSAYAGTSADGLVPVY